MNGQEGTWQRQSAIVRRHTSRQSRLAYKPGSNTRYLENAEGWVLSAGQEMIMWEPMT